MPCRVVQLHDAVTGMVVAFSARPMVHFFRVGAQLVRRDLTEARARLETASSGIIQGYNRRAFPLIGFAS